MPTPKYIPYMDPDYTYNPELKATIMASSDHPVTGEIYGCRIVRIVPGNHVQMAKEMQDGNYSNENTHRFTDYGFTNPDVLEIVRARHSYSYNGTEAIHQHILTVCESMLKEDCHRENIAFLRAYPVSTWVGKGKNRELKETNNLDFKILESSNKEYTKFFLTQLYDLLNLLKTEKDTEQKNEALAKKEKNSKKEAIFEIVITDFNLERAVGLKELLKEFVEKDSKLELARENDRYILRFKNQEKENKLLGGFSELKKEGQKMIEIGRKFLKLPKPR